MNDIVPLSSAEESHADVRPRVMVREYGSCNGCQTTLLQLKSAFLAITKKLNFVEVRLLQIGLHEGDFEFLIIEGTITTEEELHEVQQLATRAKYVIAMGSCAHIGGFPAGAPPRAVHAAQQGAFGKLIQSYGNIQPRPVVEIPGVHIHAVIRGCPPNPIQMEMVFRTLLAKGRPELSVQPVCNDCALNGTQCLIKQGIACMGMLTVGGCGAPCPKSGTSCFGCFGMLPHARHEANLLLHEQYRVPIEELVELYYMNNRWPVEHDSTLADILTIDLTELQEEQL
jgi:sulfhydrogenase subunit delta